MKTKTIKPLTTAQFNRLSKPAQRVAIALDVLAQLKAKAYQARQRTYLCISRFNKNSPLTQNSVITGITPRKPCHVCAIGAGFTSGLRLANEFQSTYGQIDSAVMYKFLSRWFTMAQLRLIEAVFEGWGVKNADRQRVTEFKTRFPLQHERLVAIFENIVKNKGTFKP